MDVIGRNDPNTFQQMYPNSKQGEYLSSIAFKHRKMKSEELDEKVDMQTKSYINDIARAMTKDKLMTPFADKFKKDAMKTGKPKDSLEDVLPDYIAGKDIAKLLNMGEETELDERFSPKEIKMAIGIASDPRYAKGNMTGAVKAIEKMKRGLSDHPQVAAVLKRQNEGFASDAQRRAAFAQGYKAKGKKGKKEEVKEKLMNAYRQQWKELGEKRDPADIDVKATSKDQEMADQNVVMQLRRAGNLGGTKEVKFGDGKKVKVKPQIAQRVMSKMMTLRTTQEKEKFQKQIGKSYRDLLNALK